MKNLYEAGTVAKVKGRISQLRPDSERQWGKMNPAQAVAHCSVAMEWAVGDIRPPRMFLGRIFGPMVKSKALGDERPMGKNAPTAKSLVVADERDLGAEQKRLCALIDRFASAGLEGCTTSAHLLWATNTGGVGDADVQTSGSSSAAVWRLMRVSR